MSEPEFKIGDQVRDNWSSIYGEIVGLKGSQARVLYPNGRTITSKIGWLVPHPE